MFNVWRYQVFDCAHGGDLPFYGRSQGSRTENSEKSIFHLNFDMLAKYVADDNLETTYRCSPTNLDPTTSRKWHRTSQYPRIDLPNDHHPLWDRWCKRRAPISGLKDFY